MIVTAGVNYKMISGESINENVSLISTVSNAYAYAENGNLTWDDIEGWLNDLDDWGGHDGEEVNEDVCDAVFQICDALDLTGDPVTEDRQYPDGTWTTDETDPCDGQPNWC